MRFYLICMSSSLVKRVVSTDWESTQPELNCVCSIHSGEEKKKEKKKKIILAKINVGGLLESLIMCVSGKLAVMSQETALVHIH